MLRRSRLLTCLTVALVASTTVGACGTGAAGDGDEGQASGGASGADAGGGSGGGTAGTLGGKPCSGPGECDAGSFCSAAGVCISDGSCAAKADCPDAAFCSAVGRCAPDGTCLDNADCADGLVCDPKNQCVPGGECGGEEFNIEAIAPNMLLSLDRSCSMLFGGNITNSKWKQAVDAISLLTTKFKGQVRWGLTLFPDKFGDPCKQDGAVAIPLGDNNESAIQKLLADALQTPDPNYPSGPCTTPIDSAVWQASLQPQLSDPSRANFVVLITDGAQFCGTGEQQTSAHGGDPFTQQKLAQMSAAGIKTFILGFGTGTQAGVLDTFAVAGGVPRPGTPKHYHADNASELEMALNQIAGSIVGCSFSLDKKPADPNRVYVFFNDQSVARGTTNGWDYNDATGELVFFGSACSQLKSGSVKDIDVVFGCNMPTPN